MKSCGLQQVVQEVQRRELSGQENFGMEQGLQNLIGQAAQDPCSDKTRNESREARESRVQWMKHVLTIGSETRGGSTGCVRDSRGDRSTLGRPDEPRVTIET